MPKTDTALQKDGNPQQTEFILTEYTQVSENLRHFGNIRFAQMTLFFAVTAVLAAGLSQATLQVSESVSVFLRLGGVAFSLLFWWMDERAMAYWRHYLQCAIKLERRLGFDQYSTAPARSRYSATNAVRIIYFMLILFWAATLIWYPHF